MRERPVKYLVSYKECGDNHSTNITVETTRIKGSQNIQEGRTKSYELRERGEETSDGTTKRVTQDMSDLANTASPQGHRPPSAKICKGHDHKNSMEESHYTAHNIYGPVMIHQKARQKTYYR